MAIGRKLFMVNDKNNSILLVVEKTQLKELSEKGLHIVQVSFDNENDPILLASDEKRPLEVYIKFVNNLGLFADKNYRIDGYK